jgi:hypothetical protein
MRRHPASRGRGISPFVTSLRKNDGDSDRYTAASASSSPRRTTIRFAIVALEGIPPCTRRRLVAGDICVARAGDQRVLDLLLQAGYLCVIY